MPIPCRLQFHLLKEVPQWLSDFIRARHLLRALSRGCRPDAIPAEGKVCPRRRAQVVVLKVPEGGRNPNIEVYDNLRINSRMYVVRPVFREATKSNPEPSGVMYLRLHRPMALSQNSQDRR